MPQMILSSVLLPQPLATHQPKRLALTDVEADAVQDREALRGRGG